MNKNIFIISIFFIFSLTIYPQGIKEASERYKNGEYQKALEIYQNLNNNYNPYIIYNIGNCYYKMGDKPRALANFIKAFKILPRNSKIKENMIKTASENGELLFSEDIPKFAYAIYYFFSDFELVALFEIFFILFVFFILIESKRKDTTFMPYILICFILFSMFGIWHMMRKNSIFYNPAVVIEEANVFSGPQTSFNILATVPRGRVVTVLSENNNFLEIGIPRENIKGWVKKDDLVKID